MTYTREMSRDATGRILSAMYRRGSVAGVATLAVAALVVVVMALDRDSNLTTAVAIVPPSFPPAVSASSSPVATASAVKFTCQSRRHKPDGERKRCASAAGCRVPR